MVFKVSSDSLLLNVSLVGGGGGGGGGAGAGAGAGAVAAVLLY